MPTQPLLPWLHPLKASSFGTIGIVFALIGIDQLAKALFPVVHTTNRQSLLLTIGVLIALAGWYYIAPAKLKISVAIVIAGGLSNLIDFVWFGHIRDIFTISTFAFNLADIVIIGGLAAIILTGLSHLRQV